MPKRARENCGSIIRNASDGQDLLTPEDREKLLSVLTELAAPMKQAEKAVQDMATLKLAWMLEQQRQIIAAESLGLLSAAIDATETYRVELLKLARDPGVEALNLELRTKPKRKRAIIYNFQAECEQMAISSAMLREDMLELHQRAVEAYPVTRGRAADDNMTKLMNGLKTIYAEATGRKRTTVLTVRDVGERNLSRKLTKFGRFVQVCEQVLSIPQLTSTLDRAARTTRKKASPAGK